MNADRACRDRERLKVVCTSVGGRSAEILLSDAQLDTLRKIFWKFQLKPFNHLE